jgi:hypothetical protein
MRGSREKKRQVGCLQVLLRYSNSDDSEQSVSKVELERELELKLWADFHGVIQVLYSYIAEASSTKSFRLQTRGNRARYLPYLRGLKTPQTSNLPVIIPISDVLPTSFNIHLIHAPLYIQPST